MACDTHAGYWSAWCMTCEISKLTSAHLEREKLMRDALRAALAELVAANPRYLKDLNIPRGPEEEYIAKFIRGEV